jgi:hypothetical protein
MENIFVESNKTYKQGFILTEQEFRRIIDIISEQLKKSVKKEEPKLNYLVKFENGVIAKTESLEEIFNLENGGIGEIIRVQITGEIGENENNHIISIIFKNTNSENESSNTAPINHIIKGKSRDWVFVTSSLIQERINKLKQSGVITKMHSRPENESMILISILLFLLTTISFLWKYFISGKNYIEQIETKWKANEISDPIEVLIAFEKNKDTLQNEPLKYIMGTFFIFLIIFYSIKSFTKKYYPSYNFCWGDYLEEYSKKEKFRKGFFTVFLIGLIVSIIGGLIANFIGK